MPEATSNKRFSLSIGLIALAILLRLTLITSANVDLVKAQSDKISHQEKQSPSNNYGFAEEAPSGDWSAQSDIDVSQSDDPNVPVVIAGIRSYAGKGRWGKHVMVESVILKNHTEKSVEAVKFGWIIITEEDRIAYRNRDAALIQGFTSFFEAELPGHKFKRVEGVYIDIVKEAMTLIKDGRLSGRFWLRIRMSEIRFADGSVWKENGF